MRTGCVRDSYGIRTGCVRDARLRGRPGVVHRVAPAAVDAHRGEGLDVLLPAQLQIHLPARPGVSPASAPRQPRVSTTYSPASAPHQPRVSTASAPRQRRISATSAPHVYGVNSATARVWRGVWRGFGAELNAALGVAFSGGFWHGVLSGQRQRGVGCEGLCAGAQVERRLWLEAHRSGTVNGPHAKAGFRGHLRKRAHGLDLMQHANRHPEAATGASGPSTRPKKRRAWKINSGGKNCRKRKTRPGGADRKGADRKGAAAEAVGQSAPPAAFGPPAPLHAPTPAQSCAPCGHLSLRK